MYVCFLFLDVIHLPCLHNLPHSLLLSTGPRDIRCWTESPKIVIISDSYENIMEKRKKHEAPLCICSPVGAELIGFNSLPVGLCSMIFLVAQQTEAELLKARALLLVILCWSVCKLWRSLLPPPAKESNTSTDRFFDCVAVRVGYLSVLQWVVEIAGLWFWVHMFTKSYPILSSFSSHVGV